MLGERSNCATAVAIMFEFCVEMTRKEVTVQTIGDNHAEIGGGIPPPTFGKFLPVKSFNLSFFTSNTMGFFIYSSSDLGQEFRCHIFFPVDLFKSIEKQCFI